VWSPYTCRTRAKDRLGLVCIFLMSVALWMYRKFWRKWGSTIVPKALGLRWGTLRRVLVISEQVGNRQGKGLALRSTSYGFGISEVHSEFGVQNKAKVLKLVDFVDRV